jgi:hypothetical protein
MSMTPDAKSLLSKTIRALRASLLDDLRGETERVYRLAIKSDDAGLNQMLLIKRQRLEAWLEEQVRAEVVRGKQQRSRSDFLRDVEKQAAYTLLNRLVFLRILEAFEQRSPQIVTGGWNSLGYKNFREIAPALIRNDETEGYAFLLKLVFEDLAFDLPGLYGPAGMADLIPVPAKTLRSLVDAFDDKELRTCWTDDMTLGWVYQYWNDPEREALDAKINGGGKIEPHEIASKTQMFTERYMVDWLLQNSLGPMWLAMCKRHGWTPEVEADGTLERLEQRRIEWRARRDAGEVSLTELMPLHTDAERRWAYYVPQPIPQDAIDHAPDSVWKLKILDPAVGSGHFLVVAFDLLFALYEEEARHRSPDPIDSKETPPKSLRSLSSLESLSASTEQGVHAGRVRHSQQIVERILGHNLHGIDLDPRAVQIAAAALWLKGRLTSPEAQPEQLNLVASNLRLASLPDDDPALVELRRTVEAETGIPGTLTDEIVHALRGADHLGSLLKVDAAVEDAIRQHESQIRLTGGLKQKRLFDDGPTQKMLSFPKEELKASVLDRLEEFLSRHTSGDDLGLRLRGEQLTAGVRFLRLVREGTYDLIVANPPYQGTSKMADAKYVAMHYKLGKADLFSAFLLRALELVREHGASAMLTMRNWMFIKQYADLRQHLLETYDLRAIGDFDRGAFEEILDEVVSVAVACIGRAPHRVESVAQCPTPLDDRCRDNERAQRKRSATLCHVGRQAFNPAALKVVPQWPLVYWWNDLFLKKYSGVRKLGDAFDVKQGMATANNIRFLRNIWEVSHHRVGINRFSSIPFVVENWTWIPYVKGAEGLAWFEPLSEILLWKHHAIESHEVPGSTAGKNESYYFRKGIAFTSTGSTISARVHRYRSVFDVKGQSFFPVDVAESLCLFNSTRSRKLLADLNPTISFQVGDAKRLPMFPTIGAAVIIERLEQEFSDHESHRENSVEFRHPGPSSWRQAQVWAQLAVDRPEGGPLPEYVPQFDPEPPTDHLSFALGVALGRFGANGEGILDPGGHPSDVSGCPSPPAPLPGLPGRGEQETSSSLSCKEISGRGERDVFATLPAGILFLDGTLDANDRRDSLGHSAAKPLLQAWETYSAQIAPRSSLREYLSDKFFEAVHRKMYESRPIHWPLSSEKKTFVAWVTIHRWNESTLRLLLADHLQPTLTRLEGELTDLRIARDGADKKEAKEADKQFGEVHKSRDELVAFIKQVEQCAEKGPPPTDSACPPREVDARYVPDLDDGVMINSAALWPLLTPQWKEPKKWWKELATSKGKKDYDWSHLAMRYWPTRVDAKCQQDPSLGVAHSCFWTYHPARAWAWELRLQDEIGADFRIQEGEASHGYRETFIRDHPGEALAAIEKEVLRRRRKQKKPQPIMSILEAGLWSTVPDQVWSLELRISEKQGVEFRLLAPDEPDSRSAYETDHPQLVKARKQLIAGMAPVAELFDDEEDEAPVDDETENTEEEQ